MILLFARPDCRSIEILNDIFSTREGFIWFIENRESKMWIMEEDETQLTSDPLLAKKFSTEPKAWSYCFEKGLGKEFVPTEHEFI